MLKWLILFALAYVVYRWWSRTSVPGSDRKTNANGEQMIECAQCSVHFPKSETIEFEGQHFCCEQHRIAWKQSH